MTAGTTGRRRSVSLMTASRYSPSVPSLADLLDQAVEHGRVAHEALQRPGQRGRGGLVPGDEQRHQLVAQLLVGHRGAVLVARLQQQREHVVALGRRRGAALADLLVEDLVGGRGGGAKARPRAPVAVPAHAEGEGEHAPTRGGDVEDLAQRGAQRVEAGRVLDPEYGAHDHLERDGLGVGEDGERLAHRPARHLALGRLAHDLGVGGHPLSVERGQEQLALAHVLRAVEQQHGVGAEQGREHAVSLAGVEQVRIAGEDALDLLRIGREHDRAIGDRAHRERVAVAPVQALQELRRPEDERRHQEGTREIGAGGERGPEIASHTGRYRNTC